VPNLTPVHSDPALPKERTRLRDFESPADVTAGSVFALMLPNPIDVVIHANASTSRLTWAEAVDRAYGLITTPTTTMVAESASRHEWWSKNSSLGDRTGFVIFDVDLLGRAESDIPWLEAIAGRGDKVIFAPFAQRGGYEPTDIGTARVLASADLVSESRTPRRRPGFADPS
jgi:hypothetical protein